MAHHQLYFINNNNNNKLETPSAGAWLFVTFNKRPVFGELCQRSMSFVRSCLSHDFLVISLIRFVAIGLLRIVHARSQLFLGHMFYFAHTVTIFVLTSVIGLVRLII